MGSERILPYLMNREKILASLYAFFTLRFMIIAFTIGAFLAIALFIFTLLIDALADLCTHIAQVWQQSGSIERLLIFLVAIYLFNKLSPVVARACKGKVL